MLHTCAARFDVTGNFENFLDFGVKQGLKEKEKEKEKPVQAATGSPRTGDQWKRRRSSAQFPSSPPAAAWRAASQRFPSWNRG
jgi:hypothetical protein